MKKELLSKTLVMGVIALFVGVGFTSGIGVNVEQTSNPLNAGETAWWKFDEGSGNTAYDSSGHGYDGTVYDATWTADGLSFDGMDDYVDFDTHATALGMNKTDDYVILVRFRSTGSGMLYSMSHTHPDRAYFDLMLNDEGKITVEMGDITCLFDLSTSGSFNDGEWHLVECYFEGDTTNPTLNLYVDDENEATTTEWLSPMIDEDFITAKVGRDSNAESDYFDGEIDDIKIYKNVYCCGDPPEAPTITGPMNGPPGENIVFTFNAVDPDGDDVRFYIDWGDGELDITNYVPSGTDQAVSHMWNTRGGYTITAYAEDENGYYGPSSTMPIPILINKPLNFNFNHILQVLLPRSISIEEVKYETTVRIHNSRVITPYTLKLTEKESDEVDRIFDNLKVSLDSAVTDEEIDEIYDDAVESLYELGLFPKMTVEEAKHLVNGEKSQSGNLGNADENFNCSIIGKTTETFMFDLDTPSLNNLLWYLRNFFFISGIEHWRHINLLNYNGEIGEISFGSYERDGNDYYPADGWVSTDGSNGVVEWNGEFYGNLGKKLVYEDVWYNIREWVYTGVFNFKGIWIGRLFPYKPVYFIGNAEHVSLSYNPFWP